MSIIFIKYSLFIFFYKAGNLTPVSSTVTKLNITSDTTQYSNVSLSATLASDE